MTNDKTIKACARSGWMAWYRGGWWHITLPWMAYPQAVSARTLRRCYRLAKEFV